jgi:hypothetical protein
MVEASVPEHRESRTEAARSWLAAILNDHDAYRSIAKGMPERPAMRPHFKR